MKKKRKMKIVLIVICVIIALLLLFVAAIPLVRHFKSSALNNHTKIAPDESTGIYFLNSNDGIVALEDGLLAVRYDGDYGFDAFLEQGGSETDRGLLDFFRSYYGAAARGLSIESGGFGCSTLSAKSEAGGYLFGRNFDFMPCDAMIVEAHPRNGYASISTVDIDFIHMGTRFQSVAMSDEALTLAALYVPLDGINEKGLCVSVNMIQDSATIQQSTDKSDLTTTTAIRLILDKAATVDEAVALLEEYDLHASFNFMVHFALSDASGKSVVVEYINNQIKVTETPVVTNFYLAQGDKYGIGTAQSMTRYNILMDGISDKPELSADDVRDLLDSVSKHNYDDGESTEWSVIFDQSAMTARYYHREDYTRYFDFALVTGGEVGQ